MQAGGLLISQSCHCVSQGSLEKQNQWDTYRFTEIHHEGLEHVIMEAENSHGLPSASWRPRRNRDVIKLSPKA